MFGWYEKIERWKTFYLAKSNIKGGMRGHMGNFLSNLLPLPFLLPPPFSPQFEETIILHQMMGSWKKHLIMTKITPPLPFLTKHASPPLFSLLPTNHPNQSLHKWNSIYILNHSYQTVPREDLKWKLLVKLIHFSSKIMYICYN